MINCGKTCSNSQKTVSYRDPIQATIDEIQKIFKKEGPAINYCSDHETYLKMLTSAPFYVSEVYSQEDNVTWWAAAESKKAYDEWEKHVEHQHHPQTRHEYDPE